MEINATIVYSITSQSQWIAHTKGLPSFHFSISTVHLNYRSTTKWNCVAVHWIPIPIFDYTNPSLFILCFRRDRYLCSIHTHTELGKKKMYYQGREWSTKRGAHWIMMLSHCVSRELRHTHTHTGPTSMLRIHYKIKKFYEKNQNAESDYQHWIVK